MQRRDFTRAAMALTGSAVAASTLLPVTAQAQGAFEAGKDYLVLKQAAPVDAPAGQVEVVEFFWYNCPHCNAFEPTLEAWVARLPKGVAFRRVPVAFRPTYKAQQQFYYTLEAMGLVDKLHAKVFRAIHVERQILEDPNVILDWVGKQGVDKKKFFDTFNSFGVATKVGKANQLLAAYEVDGVPALGVAGRYYTDASLTRSMERSLQVVEYLVGEVKKGR